MKHSFLHSERLQLDILILLSLGGFLLPLQQASSDVIQHPTFHEQDSITTADRQRLWYHEDEFQRDPSLRATPGQVVILHLEPNDRGRKIVSNTIPYHFAETAPYRFCVPVDDAHIRALELRREGLPGVVVRIPRGVPCKPRMIEAGLYQLDVQHDGSAIGREGKKAFVHVPLTKDKENENVRRNTKLTALATSMTSSFPTCDPTNPENNPFIQFTAPNSMFVASDYGDTAIAITQSEPDDVLGSWVFCPDGSGNYTLQQGINAIPLSSQGPANPADTRLYIDYPPTPFKITEMSNGQFTMAANFSGELYPIVVGADNVLHWAAPGTSPTVFSIKLKYYLVAVKAQDLQNSETALFQECNYDTTTFGTWVFGTSIPDLSAFRFFTIPLTTVSSIKIGPQTVAELYENANYHGRKQTLTEDVPCLSSSSINFNPSALKIFPARDFIASTNNCQNCNLSGVDLSNLDLSRGRFQSSTFTGANLTNTIFDNAILDGANLNGAGTLLTDTSLIAANMNCTNLSGADLSTAIFISGGHPPANPQNAILCLEFPNACAYFTADQMPTITTNFTCRVDLTDATLNLSTFPLTQWRYFNLTGAVVNGISDAILSSTTDKLNLRGAILNHMNLSNTTLDGADLGCAGSVCSQLIGTDLNSASLKQANLVSAILQGAHLDFSNLEGANLCSAKLNESSIKISATLQGAYLKNVNLATADLTGANLRNANFYSSFETKTCFTTSCGATPNCASAVGANLDNAVLEGAYLNGADFSDATLQSAVFANAYLVGANFTGANLSQDPATGKATDFTGAFLQGTNFTSPKSVTGTIFTNAIVDLTNSNGAIQLMQLDPTKNIQFPGYTQSTDSTLGCVEFNYSSVSVLPATDNTNLCPDGNIGPCSSAQWQAPKSPPPPLPANCTTQTTDLNWIFD